MWLLTMHAYEDESGTGFTIIACFYAQVIEDWRIVFQSLSQQKRVLLWELLHVGVLRHAIPFEVFNYIRRDLVIGEPLPLEASGSLQSSQLCRVDSPMLRAALAVRTYLPFQSCLRMVMLVASTRRLDKCAHDARHK
jgi:hypothetical protein